MVEEETSTKKELKAMAETSVAPALVVAPVTPPAPVAASVAVPAPVVAAPAVPSVPVASAPVAPPAQTPVAAVPAPTAVSVAVPAPVAAAPIPVAAPAIPSVPVPAPVASAPAEEKPGEEVPEWEKKTSWTAIIALILSVLLSPLGLALGLAALSKIKHSPGLKGKGIAITAVIVGGLLTLGSIGFATYALLFSPSI